MVIKSGVSQDERCVDKREDHGGAGRTVGKGRERAGTAELLQPSERAVSQQATYNIPTPVTAPSPVPVHPNTHAQTIHQPCDQHPYHPRGVADGISIT